MGIKAFPKTSFEKKSCLLKINNLPGTIEVGYFFNNFTEQGFFEVVEPN